MVEVSVIIPAHNSGHTLLRALRSACDQWLRDIEIIVVDDASQDHTPEIALSIARVDPRIRVIRQSTNGGPSAARNAALEVARGKWIAPLDADDLYLPQRLSLLTEAVRSAECDLVADNVMLRCPESGRCLGLAIPPGVANPGRLLTSADFARNDRPFSGGFSQLGYLMPLIRRAFLDEHRIRYDADIWLAEDFVLYMRCLLAGTRMLLLPDAYYLYTLSEESLSRGAANLARNYEHLEKGNARLIADARRRRNRATFVQLKRRGRNIAFLRAYQSCKHAAHSGRWSEAVAHLLRMPRAPFDLARLLSMYFRRKISGLQGIRHLSERSARIGKQPAC